MDPYALDWLNLLIRWVHLIVGIAWIGSSFYFVWLDNTLLPPKRKADADEGVGGELWAVHGGGFYHVQKFRVAPAELPAPLHWFKWEAYTTWMSGFALLVVQYYLNARTYMIDPAVADLAPWQAVAISLGLHRAGLGALRPAVQASAASRTSARSRWRWSPSSPRSPTRCRTCSPGARCTCRSARCSARSWPRTCCS